MAQWLRRNLHRRRWTRRKRWVFRGSRRRRRKRRWALRRMWRVGWTWRRTWRRRRWTWKRARRWVWGVWRRGRSWRRWVHVDHHSRAPGDAHGRTRVRELFQRRGRHPVHKLFDRVLLRGVSARHDRRVGKPRTCTRVNQGKADWFHRGNRRPRQQVAPLPRALLGHGNSAYLLYYRIVEVSIPEVWEQWRKARTGRGKSSEGHHASLRRLSSLV
jgi:hypothetical protein